MNIVFKKVAAFCAIFTLMAASVNAGLDESKIRTSVYVSSSSGSDDNAGTIDAPLKSFAKMPRKNVKIYLKSGDVFYGGMHGISDCVVDSYSSGPKAIISGFKRLKNPNAWEMVSENIWRLDLSKDENFEGNIDGDAHTPKCLNNVGAIYDAKNDTLHGHLVQNKSDLKADWDFFTTSVSKREEVDDETFKYIYVRLPHNPSEGADLHFSTYSIGMSGLRNCLVKNIAIKGFGRHGVSGIFESKFYNLEVDVIGGSIQVGYPSKWVRLGNGFEFWISDSNPQNFNLVENCTISRTYDCATTIQGIGKNLKNAEGIRFINNKIYHCRQAFEHFLKTEHGEVSYINCEFSGNFCYEMGENEFSTPELRDVNLLSYDRFFHAIKIHNNTFYGSGIYCGRTWSTDMKNNTFYVFKGQALSICHYDKNFSTITANNVDDIEAYRERFKDFTSKINLVERDDSALRDKLLENEFSFVKKFLNKNGK